MSPISPIFLFPVLLVVLQPAPPADIVGVWEPRYRFDGDDEWYDVGQTIVITKMPKSATQYRLAWYSRYEKDAPNKEFASGTIQKQNGELYRGKITYFARKTKEKSWSECEFRWDRDCKEFRLHLEKNEALQMRKVSGLPK